MPTGLKIPESGHTRLIIGLLLLCILMVLFIRIRLVNVVVPNVGGIEQNVIYSCQTLASGKTLYTDPELEPYSFIQYTPLYFYLVAAGGKLMGIQAGEPFHWCALSRFMSLIFNLLLIIVVYFSLRKLYTGRPWNHLLTALLLFVFFEQQDYSRPDSLYHLFFALTIFQFTRIYRLRGNNGIRLPLILAAVFLSLSIFSKQSGVFLLLYTLIALVILKVRLRNSLLFMAAFVLSTALLYLLLLPEPPMVVYKNIVIGIMNGFDLAWAIRLYLLPALPRFMVFFFVIILALLFRRQAQLAGLWFLTAGALFYVIIAVMSGMKWGSGTNYFFECCLLSLLLIPALLQLFSDTWKPEILKPMLLAAVIVFILPQPGIVAWRDYYKNDLDTYIKERQLSNSLRAKPWFKAEDRVVVLQQTWLNNFLYDKALFPQPDVITTFFPPARKQQIYKPKQPDTTGTIYLITNYPKFLPEVFHLNTAHYRPIWMQHEWLVLGPENL
ncbi:MAG TPA: hypothetical protein P5531_12225 [Bacteroidales bacterium]|nr:hypothetical protein [Bacteroidales bacterium]HSA44274.1 hypothetical protein [Bacteroidales bacterium]